jgi:hypothetical protein
MVLVLAACCILAAFALWALWPVDGPSDGPPDFHDRGHNV